MCTHEGRVQRTKVSRPWADCSSPSWAHMRLQAARDESHSFQHCPASRTGPPLVSDDARVWVVGTASAWELRCDITRRVLCDMAMPQSDRRLCEGAHLLLGARAGPRGGSWPAMKKNMACRSNHQLSLNSPFSRWLTRAVCSQVPPQPPRISGVLQHRRRYRATPSIAAVSPDDSHHDDIGQLDPTATSTQQQEVAAAAG